MIKRIIALTLAMLMLFSFGTNVFAFGIDGRVYLEAYRGVQKKIPALMYHKVTENPDEVTDWVITSNMLRTDFEEIKHRGYTPITVNEYYKIVKLEKEKFVGDNYKKIAEFYRENPKPIIITFDDGYKGIYTHVLPLMQEYGFKVNFYICGELIDSQHPEYCTWEEIKALYDSGYAEIGNHTYSLHSQAKDEIYTTYHMFYEDALADILKNNKVITDNIGVTPVTFSVPYGQYDPITIQKLKNAGFEYFVSTDYRTNKVTDKKIALGRFNRSGLINTAEYFDMVDNMCK